MTGSIRAAMLLTDGFGGRGGIAKFNRDFLTALAVSGHLEGVHALPRVIPEPMNCDIPQAVAQTVVYDRQAAAGKLAYLRRLVRLLPGRAKIDVVVCGHLNLLPAAWLLARCRGAHLILIVHGIEAWTPPSKVLAQWLAARIDALISVSRLTAERFSSWSNWPAGRAFILPNGVDLERFTPRPVNPALRTKYALDGHRLIMTLGRLDATERKKGVDELIDLMPRLLRTYPDLKYLVAGDGDDRARLEAKAAARDLAGAVIFAGRIGEADKPDIYNLADAYVMPSSGEGFGIVLIEAAACGVPVIGSVMDGARETLLGGELGLLVDPADADALYGAIATVLDGARPKRRNRRVEMFSAERFADRVALWSAQLAETIDGRRPHVARGRAL